MTVLNTSEFYYDLPSELIAQMPLKQRDKCRLLHLCRKSGSVEHLKFMDIKRLVRCGDRLVLNDTKVIPARLFGKKETGAQIEFLFLEKIDELCWKAMAKPAKRLHEGVRVKVNGVENTFLNIDKVLPDGERVIRLEENDEGFDMEQLLNRYGHLPLPPYIDRADCEIDKEAYQTVYSKKPGAVAAPTAGLHFTDELLGELVNSGIDISYLTLHVGAGTFRPVKVSDPRRHEMHEEIYELTPQTVREIEETRKNGGRVIAVGTTVVRVLEHCSSDGKLTSSCGKTKLMILPPFNFKTVDGLITNFHLPLSTLLMLVCAFGGTSNVLKAYSDAVLEKYRFFSYGDAMFII
ncbi:MAG: tRNA preQ1(34) S-adenosylmethionine ribosyltransferase-isomerase QueA [Fibrobacter sp.]|nr:tRNA preQ1(34) S-adenosylmethionine ribosyltransferase-isomerase QueA [Fibrobacter sp.]